MEQMKEIIVTHKEVGKLQDSLTVGSPTKNCEIKVYCDFNNPEEAKKKIDEALKLRNYLMEQVSQ